MERKGEDFMARLVVFTLLVVVVLALIGSLVGGTPSNSGSKQVINSGTSRIAKVSLTTYNANARETTDYQTTALSSSQTEKDYSQDNNALGQVVAGAAGFLAGLHSLLSGLFQAIQNSPSGMAPFWGAIELLVVVLMTCGLLHLAWERSITRIRR
jgi:hypothetical protein